MAREDEIKVIAYSIWEEEGCPDGRDCEHWYRAEIIWKDRQQAKTPSAAASHAKTAAKAKPAARRPRKAAAK